MLATAAASVATLAARVKTAMDNGSSGQIAFAEEKHANATRDMDRLSRMIDASERQIPALKAAEATATDALVAAISAFNHDATAHLDGFRADYDSHAAWFASKLESEANLQSRFAQICRELQRASPLVREAITCALVAFHPFSPRSGALHLRECVARLPALRDPDASDTSRPGFWPPIPASTWQAPPPPRPPPGPSSLRSRTVIYEVRNPPGPFMPDDDDLPVRAAAAE
jgi:hypothetical protein